MNILKQNLSYVNITEKKGKEKENILDTGKP